MYFALIITKNTDVPKMIFEHFQNKKKIKLVFFLALINLI